MKKNILLLFIILGFCTFKLFSQFTKSQAEELTALGISSAIEPDNPAVKNKAQDLTSAYRDSAFIQNACAVFDNIYRNWNYQPDPGGMEYFEKAGVSVYTYSGDCDDYAILMVSMIKSLGGNGRVVCVSGHAYPEMYLGSNLSAGELRSLQENINLYYEHRGSKTRIKTLNYHTGSNGSYWLNMDYQDRYPGGSFFEYSGNSEHLIIYPDGSYELAYLNK